MRSTQTLASIAALARLSALLELSPRVEFQVNDQTYMKSNRRLSFNDSLLCLYRVIETGSDERRGCCQQPLLCVPGYAILLSLY